MKDAPVAEISVSKRDLSWIWQSQLGIFSEVKTANDPVYIEFIARLRTARKSMSFTQADLAAALNQPQSFVSKVETCERRIDVVEAARWCFALGVKMEDVLPTQFRPRA